MVPLSNTPCSPALWSVLWSLFPGLSGGGGLREVWVLERERYWLQVKQLFVCTTWGINKSGFACWTFAYTICVLWKNRLIVLLLQGCENTGSASLCFKQHRNECEIRKSTSSFLQSVDYLNRQLWAWVRNGEVESHGLCREGNQDGWPKNPPWMTGVFPKQQHLIAGSSRLQWHHGRDQSKEQWWPRDKASHGSRCALCIFVGFHF